jgi:hypothetical protein
MGYTTEFKGVGFWTEPQLRPEHRAFINAFAERRHMTLDASKIEAGPTRSAVGLDAGDHGINVLGDDTLEGDKLDMGSRINRSDYIVDYNRVPPGVPGLWCQWVVDDQGNINWDGNEKFYNYLEWLSFLMERYLKPWGYTLEGTVDWQGEDDDDFGRIIVSKNEITSVFQWRGV